MINLSFELEDCTLYLQNSCLLLNTKYTIKRPYHSPLQQNCGPKLIYFITDYALKNQQIDSLHIILTLPLLGSLSLFKTSL